MATTKPSRAKALIEWCEGRGIKRLKYKDIEIEFYPSPTEIKTLAKQPYVSIRDEMNIELDQELSANEQIEAKRKRNNELLYWSA